MRTILLALGIMAFTIACTDSEPVAVGATATATATPQRGVSPVPSAPTATGTVTPIPTVVVTETPEPTASATPTVVAAPEVRPGDASGVPFSTLDVRLAVEEGRGYSFWLVEQRDALCPTSSIPGGSYWSAALLGSDFGPVYTLWVYPDVDALKQGLGSCSR